MFVLSRIGKLLVNMKNDNSHHKRMQYCGMWIDFTNGFHGGNGRLQLSCEVVVLSYLRL